MNAWEKLMRRYSGFPLRRGNYSSHHICLLSTSNYWQFETRSLPATASPARTSLLPSSLMPVRSKTRRGDLGPFYACRAVLSRRSFNEDGSIREGGLFIPFTPFSGDDLMCGSEAVQQKVQ